jgi:hypothetical protein
MVKLPPTAVLCVILLFIISRFSKCYSLCSIELVASIDVSTYILVSKYINISDKFYVMEKVVYK